jgi:transcription elongation factor Elf1
LPTQFACLFCNHDKSVSVKIDRKLGVGNLSCKVCGQTFQTTINGAFISNKYLSLTANCLMTIALSAPVDVYADWVDACEEVNRPTGNDSSKFTSASQRDLDSQSRNAAASGASGYGGDDFIVEDDLDAEGEYADDDE